MEEIKQEKQKMRTSTKWAIAVTVVWLGGVAAYVFFKWDKFLTMEPNALGDFLAGTMSPLALFWLVAGYRQQGEELRLNTSALEAQLKELALQVRSTQELAGSAKEQAKIAQLAYTSEEAEKRRERRSKISPNLRLTHAGISQGAWKFSVENLGATGKNLTAASNFCTVDFRSGDREIVNKGKRLSFDMRLGPEMANETTFLSLTCLDEDNEMHVFSYIYKIVANSSEIVCRHQVPTD